MLSNVSRLPAAPDQPVDAVANGEDRKACAGDRPGCPFEVTAAVSVSVAFVLTGGVLALSIVIAGLCGQRGHRQTERQNRGGDARTELHSHLLEPAINGRI